MALAIVKGKPAMAAASKLHIVFMFGLPGAGKTTLSRQRFPGYLILDPDVMPEISSRKDAAVREAIAAHSRNLLVGSTSNSDKIDQLLWQILYAKEHGYRTELLYVKVKLETALSRNAQRGRKVSDAAIRGQAIGIQARFERLRSQVDSATIQVND
ncbi:MAG: ATP-binding protein [Thermoanaerobaculia bacterium]|nr:ATP-binding protein [Thermoanaerobaculia bacterium]